LLKDPLIPEGHNFNKMYFSSNVDYTFFDKPVFSDTNLGNYTSLRSCVYKGLTEYGLVGTEADLANFAAVEQYLATNFKLEGTHYENTDLLYERVKND
jgi:hypothetical protein